MVLYIITNKQNGKRYIGQTIRKAEIRWYEHCKKGSRKTLIDRAINKYGKENFHMKILCRCESLEQMNHREELYIKLFKTSTPNGYNLDLGGKNGLHSEATKKKQSLAHKGEKAFWYGKASVRRLPILCLNNGTIYESIRKAASELGLGASKISEIVSGKRKATKGYIFKRA